jgi:hypothetical protein
MAETARWWRGASATSIHDAAPGAARDPSNRGTRPRAKHVPRAPGQVPGPSVSVILPVMSSSMIRRAALLTMMGALATAGAGCYADAQGPMRAEGYQGEEGPPPMPAGELAQPENGPPQPAPYAPPPEGAPQAALQAPPAQVDYGPGPAPAVEVYQPLYYGGYVVYYDTGGRPFYTLGGTSYYVPASSPYYGYYAGHYRTYGTAYRGWYSRGGYRTYGSRGYYGGFRGGSRGGYRSAPRGRRR